MVTTVVLLAMAIVLVESVPVSVTEKLRDPSKSLSSLIVIVMQALGPVLLSNSTLDCVTVKS